MPAASRASTSAATTPTVPAPAAWSARMASHATWAVTTTGDHHRSRCQRRGTVTATVATSTITANAAERHVSSVSIACSPGASAEPSRPIPATISEPQRERDHDGDGRDAAGEREREPVGHEVVAAVAAARLA